jgi:tetratricopeptide (TPR) repeat protein
MASEMFEARHYPGVVALISDALDQEPECVPLLIVRARAHIALRRDLDAQADLRDIIRLDPQCGLAYRLLGELAARRDENESAAIFFREALRLDPTDREAAEWLAIVEASVRPAAVAHKLPAPATAAGRFPPARGPLDRARTANDGQPRSVTSPARASRPGSQPRFAKGTQPPDDERPTARYMSERERAARLQQQQRELVAPRTDEHLAATQTLEPAPLPPAPMPASVRFATGSSPTLDVYKPQVRPYEGPTLPGPQPLRRPVTAQPRGSTPELPGFGEYLVSTGILTRERLRAAQAYQRSMKVQLSTAIVTLGLATPQRIEWAAVAHQSQLARDR